MTPADVSSDVRFQSTAESGYFGKPFTRECAEYLKLAMR